MIPPAIDLLENRPHEFDYVIVVLRLCCEQYTPCGHMTRCKQLYNRRDNDWNWREPKEPKRPRKADASDWLQATWHGGKRNLTQ